MGREVGEERGGRKGEGAGGRDQARKREGREKRRGEGKERRGEVGREGEWREDLEHQHHILFSLSLSLTLTQRQPTSTTCLFSTAFFLFYYSPARNPPHPPTAPSPLRRGLKSTQSPTIVPNTTTDRPCRNPYTPGISRDSG